MTFRSTVEVNRRFGGIWPKLEPRNKLARSFYSTQKMDAMCSSETSVDFCCAPKSSALCSHRCEDLTSNEVHFVTALDGVCSLYKVFSSFQQMSLPSCRGNVPSTECLLVNGWGVGGTLCSFSLLHVLTLSSALFPHFPPPIHVSTLVTGSV
jgi:hypothetical protein